MTSLLEIYGKTNRLRDRDKANTQYSSLLLELFDEIFVGPPSILSSSWCNHSPSVAFLTSIINVIQLAMTRTQKPGNH
jgi:hypothetical protein